MRLTEPAGLPFRVGICRCLECRKIIGPRLLGLRTHRRRDRSARGSLDAPGQLTPTNEGWNVRRESWLPLFPLRRRYDRDPDAAGRFE